MSCRLLVNVDEYSTAGEATGDNTAYAHCTLEKKGCKHALKTCNTYCFFFASLVARTGRNVTYVHCLSSYTPSIHPHT